MALPAKKIKANVKFRLQAGKATPAPPVGSILGAQGVNMMEFVNSFNDQTRELAGALLAVKVAVCEDRSFSFSFKAEPTAGIIRRVAGVSKGAGNSKKETAGTLTIAQVSDIAATKLPDMNAHDPEGASKMIAGTARSMGVKVEG